MSCLQNFELYSISSVQCGSNLNKVLRNAATPAAVNYGFKTFMNLHFNPQMPKISQNIFRSFKKLKGFSKIWSNRSIDIINNKARYSRIDAKYRQVAFPVPSRPGTFPGLPGTGQSCCHH